VKVEGGTLLGFVGDSGNAENTPPHLHFEYRLQDGTPVNAYPLLRVSQGYEGNLSLEFLPYTGVDGGALLAVAVALLALGVSLLCLAEAYQEDERPVRRPCSSASRHRFRQRTRTTIEAHSHPPSHKRLRSRMRGGRPHGHQHPQPTRTTQCKQRPAWRDPPGVEAVNRDDEVPVIVLPSPRSVARRRPPDRLRTS
jgi:hypothetical protein